MEQLFTITKLDPTRWIEYKNLRLESLKTEPNAFLGTVSEESAYPDILWQDRLRNAQLPDEHLMLFAEKNEVIVGMIGILFEKQEKIKHTAKFVSFYVTPNERRQGIGKALIHAAMQAIKDRKHVTKISLSVSVKQEPTIKLYESIGFIKVGLLKNHVKVNAEYYDEYMMEKYTI